MKRPVTVAIVGAGSRGSIYAKYAAYNSADLKIVAIAEPVEALRQKMASEHSIATDNVFSCWRELAGKEKLADAVIIATQDHLHTEPAMAFIDKGYDILLEKPMAPTIKECKEIVSKATAKNIIFAVCHVMRYSEYTHTLKKLIESGIAGDIKGIAHIEPVGYWHYAHSFVRGNWNNEKRSNFMLLTKSCHDIDWLRYIVGARCTELSSYGDLTYFKKSQKPDGAGSRCLECAIEGQCAYSAKRIYLTKAMGGDFRWPVDVITLDLSTSGVRDALAVGPYGRCVFECDNDVVDHQVVNMCFENGVKVSFTMTAFSEFKQRETTIFGTKAEIHGNGEQIEVFEFLNGRKSTYKIENKDYKELSAHGGGDNMLMKSFVSAVAKQDKSLIYSGPAESLETHLSVFAAEEARKKHITISL